MKSSVIIIGSGLGGMACGILLARSGCPVTILEQNAIPGGCLQRFRRGNAAFDTGMHYIGSMTPGETLHTLFQQLGIDDDLPLSPLDPMGYDVVALGGKRYAFAAGREAFLKEMLRAFPTEEAALTRYADLIDETAKAASWQNSDETTVAARLTEASQTSLDETLRRLTTNERLRQVLAARLPLIAATRQRTPFLLHALITDFYARGANRIVGGGETLFKILRQRFEALGGQLLTRRRVTAITTDADGVTGVTTANGEHFEARTVVSDAAPAVTLSLINSSAIRPAFRRRIEALPQTVGCFTIYLEFKADTVDYLPYNFYSFLAGTPWDCERYTDEDWPRGYLYMQAADSIAPRYAHTAEVISYMRWEEVERWKDTTVGHRGEAYKAFKERHAQRLLAALEHDFPGPQHCYRWLRNVNASHLPRLHRHAPRQYLWHRCRLPKRNGRPRSHPLARSWSFSNGPKRQLPRTTRHAHRCHANLPHHPGLTPRAERLFQTQKGCSKDYALEHPFDK